MEPVIAGAASWSPPFNAAFLRLDPFWLIGNLYWIVATLLVCSLLVHTRLSAWLAQKGSGSIYAGARSLPEIGVAFLAEQGGNASEARAGVCVYRASCGHRLMRKTAPLSALDHIRLNKKNHTYRLLFADGRKMMFTRLISRRAELVEYLERLALANPMRDAGVEVPTVLQPEFMPQKADKTRRILRSCLAAGPFWAAPRAW